jgi:hypothetical protein
MINPFPFQIDKAFYYVDVGYNDVVAAYNLLNNTPHGVTMHSRYFSSSQQHFPSL